MLILSIIGPGIYTGFCCAVDSLAAEHSLRRRRRECSAAKLLQCSIDPA
jgi:hypothetical protein